MVKIKHKKLLISMLFLLFILMIGAVNATSDTNTTALHSDLTDTNKPHYEDSEDNININNLNAENGDKISTTKEITSNTLTNKKDTELHSNTKNNNKVVGVDGESAIDENTASMDKNIINTAEDQIKLGASANNYKLSKKDITINVGYLNGNNGFFDYGETVIMQVELNDTIRPATGNVNFTVNGKTYTQTLDKKGKAIQTFENYTVVSNIVTINYEGDNNFNKATTTHTFTIIVNDINNLYTYYGEPLNVTINFHNATGTVNISVNNIENQTVTIENGIATTLFSADSCKRSGNSLIVKYSGDGRFAPFVQNPSFNVYSKTDPTITSTVYKKENTNLVFISIPYATGSVNVTVNGAQETLDLNNGIAQKTYTGNINNLNVSYGGNFRLNPCNSSFFVTIIKGEKNIVNSTTYSHYFNQIDDWKLYDFIEEGTTLEFQGNINANQQSLVINKPVNITGKNAVIDLHTSQNDFDIDNPQNSFIITNGGSGSNITNLKITNTQILINNTNNVYLKNITITINSPHKTIYPVTIRHCNNVTIDNCNIFGGNLDQESAILYLLGTKNSTIINSELEGNNQNQRSSYIIYLKDDSYIDNNKWNEITSSHNTIKNCTIKTSGQNLDPMKNEANETIIDGIKVYSSNDLETGPYAKLINSKFYNSTAVNLGHDSIAYNNTLYKSASIDIKENTNLYNNTFRKVSISGNNITFKNNIVEDLLTIRQPINLKNNNLSSITVNAKNSNITNNTITGTITVNTNNANNATIQFNNITTNDDYAIYIKSNGAIVTNNKLYAKTKFGNDAVSVTNSVQQITLKNNLPNPTFEVLNYYIGKANANENLIIVQDYYYDSETDYGYEDGIVINKNLTIIGNGYSIDGGGQARIFQINNHASVIMNNLTLKNGKGQRERYNHNDHDVGGAITVKDFSNLTIINSKFIENHAEQNGWGGAIFVYGNSTLNIKECEFTDNYAQDAGNTIYVLDGNEVFILDSNVDEDDIGNKDEMCLLAPIKIFTTTNLVSNILSSFSEDKPATIQIIEPNNFNGLANLTTNNGQTISNIQFTNGIASKTLNLNPGVYTATIKTDYTEYKKDISKNIACIYMPANATTNEFKVLRKVDIELDVLNINYGENQIIKARINATGNVTIKLNDEIIEKYLNINDKKIEYKISGYLTAGSYTVEVIYNGDTETATQTNTTMFTVYKVNPQMKVTVNNITYEDMESIIAYVNATGNVTIKVNGKEKTIILEKGEGGHDILRTSAKEIERFEGKATLDIYNLDAGTYPVEVIYNGNENYKSKTIKTKFTVNKANTTLKIELKPTINFGETQTTNITLDNNATGNITINLEGKTYTANITNGIAQFTIPIINSGNQTITITYNGDKNFNKNTKTTPFKVLKTNTTLKIELKPSITPGETQTINIQINNPYATGNVIINIDGTDYTTNVTNGLANFTTPILNSGTYKITVTYPGDKNLNGNQTTSNLKIKYLTEFEIANIPDFTEGSTIEISITEKNKYTGIVNVNIGGETYEVNLVNGNGKTRITPQLTPGTYTAKIDFAGNENYTNTNTLSNNFKISPKPQSTPGTYTAKIDFAGNENYTNTNTLSNNFKISPKPQSTTKKTTKTKSKSTSSKTKSKIIAKTQTYKAATKIKKYKITLKTKKGKPIKNVKVTLKIKGKTYTAKTNKKGKIIFKIKKLNKKGTYIAIIKYKGNKKYKATSKKVKIRIK